MGVGWLPMNDSNHLDSKNHVFFYFVQANPEETTRQLREVGVSPRAGFVWIHNWLSQSHSLTGGGMGGIRGVCPLIFRPLTQEEVHHQAVMHCGTQTMPTSAEQWWLACLLLSPFFLEELQNSTQAAALIDIESADSSQTCRRWLLW